MNVPLLSSRDKNLVMRSFEDALHELCQRAILQGGIPWNQVSMALMHNGMAIHTQGILAQVMQPQKTNGTTLHEPEPEVAP